MSRRRREQLRADAGAERGASARSARVLADRAAAVERDDHGRRSRSCRRRPASPARRSASGSRRRAPRRAPLRRQRRARRRIVDSRDDARRSARRPREFRSATMPWPGAGTHALTGSANEMRDANPSRRSPAAASTMRVVVALRRACAAACRGCRESARSARPETAASAARCAARCPCRSTAPGRAASPGHRQS